MTRVNRQLENQNKAFFPGVGKYEIPCIQPVTIDEPIKTIDFSRARSCKEPANVGVHFFVRDYEFARLWTHPDIYAQMLSRFRFVCSPDFSTYVDYPMAVQINNHYRKHWLAAYWQSRGMTVVPTISWSDARSFAWCFDGEPTGATVAISSVGTQAHKESKRLFTLGFAVMLDTIRPRMILFHGKIPDDVNEMLNSDKNVESVVELLAFQARLRKIEGREY